MQEVQYPLLDEQQQQEIQQPQQNDIENQIAQDQLILIQQNQLQIQHHQIQPQVINPQQQLNQGRNQISRLLKDQNYEFQKYFLCGILVLFEIWYVSYSRILYFIDYELDPFYNHFYDSLTYCILSCLLLIIILFFARKKQLRIKTISFVLYLFCIIIYTLSICQITNQLWKYVDFNISQYLYLFRDMSYQNFIITLALIVYILMSDKSIDQFRILSFILVYIIVLICANGYQIYIIYGMIQFIYFYFLLNIFDKILRGKFELEKNQVFVGVMATYLDILFPMII